MNTFYTQHQDDIDKAIFWGWTFHWKKIKCEKTPVPALMRLQYKINHNENEKDTEKQIT